MTETYVSERPCKRGHQPAIRRKDNGDCLACHNIRTGEWVKRHSEKVSRAAARRYVKNRCEISQRAKARYLTNPEPAKRRAAEWAAANPHRKRATDAAWRAANAERRRAARAVYRKAAKAVIAAWNEANRERLAELRRAWHEQNPDANRTYCANRRARKMQSFGQYTVDDVADILRRQKRRCAYCRCRLDGYHVDHIVPLSRGGGNDRRNIQILCEPCNLKKHAKDPIDFARENGRLL